MRPNCIPPESPCVGQKDQKVGQTKILTWQPQIDLFGPRRSEGRVYTPCVWSSHTRASKARRSPMHTSPKTLQIRNLDIPHQSPQETLTSIHWFNPSGSNLQSSQPLSTHQETIDQTPI